jgi:hypothetical protein
LWAPFFLQWGDNGFVVVEKTGMGCLQLAPVMGIVDWADLLFVKLLRLPPSHSGASQSSGCVDESEPAYESS